MALTKAEIKGQYPLPVYNFRVTVDGTSVSFSEVSGVTLEYEIITYKHGLSFWEGEGFKKYYYNKYIPVTLKKGTVKGTNLFFEWIQEKESSSRAMDISLCDENGTPLVSWHIGKAVPVKLQAPTFDANSNEVSIESLEIMAAGIKVVHH